MPENDASPCWMTCNNAALRRATRAVGQIYDQALAPSGLRAAQYALLYQIDLAVNPTQAALAAAIVMDLSALGHTLKPLIRDGLVLLVPDTRDRRSRRVTLTPAGQVRLAEARRLWGEVQARVETAMGGEQSAALRGLLDRLASRDFAAEVGG